MEIGILIPQRNWTLKKCDEFCRVEWNASLLLAQRDDFKKSQIVRKRILQFSKYPFRPHFCEGNFCSASRNERQELLCSKISLAMQNFVILSLLIWLFIVNATASLLVGLEFDSSPVLNYCSLHSWRSVQRKLLRETFTRSVQTWDATPKKVRSSWPALPLEHLHEEPRACWWSIDSLSVTLKQWFSTFCGSWTTFFQKISDGPLCYADCWHLTRFVVQ